MSKEQANTYKKFRNAGDAEGDLGWATRVKARVLSIAPEAPPGVETEFGFDKSEQVLWRLLKLPRKYIDLENTKVMDPYNTRAFLRGLVSADILDISDDNGQAKGIIPLEIRKIKNALDGKTSKKKKVKRKAIADRVFRPDIGLDAGDPLQGASSLPEPTETPPAPKPAPKPTPKPTPKATVRASKEEKEARAAIEDIFNRLDEVSHYELLQLDENCSSDDIKTAYRNFARKWHPDAFAGTAYGDDEVLRGMLDALFKRLQEANSVLSSAGERSAYNKALAAGGGRGASGGKKVRRPQEAAIMFKKAQTFFNRKDYKNAESHFRTATELDEEDPKLKTWLWWAAFLRDPDKRKADAKKALEEILRTDAYADAAFRLGLMARMSGDDTVAVRMFKKAVTLDPNHKEAKAEVTVAERRQARAKEEAQKADKKKRGLLGRFSK